MKSQLVQCPAAEVTLEDIPADAIQSTGHHMAIELWVMIKQNNRIEAEISTETMAAQREADNVMHIWMLFVQTDALFGSVARSGLPWILR